MPIVAYADGQMTEPVYFGRTAWARSLETPLREFLRTETGGAAVLLAADGRRARLGRTSTPASYDDVWATTLSIGVGGAGRSRSTCATGSTAA